MGAERAAGVQRVPATGRGERGETLIEVIIGVMLLSMVVVAAYAGMSTAVGATASQKTAARGQTLLRSAAEQLQNPELAYRPRAGCPGVATYSIPALSTGQSGLTVAVTSVAFWTGASATPVSSKSVAFSATCPASDAADKGLQQVVIRVSDSRGMIDTVTILKRRP